MKNRIEYTLLPSDKFKNLRVIMCNGTERNEFQFYLCYLRNIDNMELDEIDNKILEALNKNSKAKFYRQEEIYRDGQVEEILKTIELAETKELIFQFNPILTEEIKLLITKGISVYGYQVNFKIRFVRGENFTHLNQFHLINLEHSINETILNSIEPI